MYGSTVIVLIVFVNKRFELFSFYPTMPSTHGRDWRAYTLRHIPSWSPDTGSGRGLWDQKSAEADKTLKTGSDGEVEGHA